MYIVTGVSRGLGKAIVENLLSTNERVIGIGRTSSFEHNNYTFLQCDLSHPEQVQNLVIDPPLEPITLINNAGILGEIKRISSQKVLSFEETFQVNTITPMVLANNIYRQIKDKNSFTLVNISSGAAHKPIPSWAGYCASKAALNRLTETFFLEEQELGNTPRVLIVAPGVIDTDMQHQIRSSSQSDFSSVENFKQMKENNQLFSPKEAANLLVKLLKDKNKSDLSVDLRNR
ncbi:MAG TPA: SDR family NAD(P)-dependent oxidoreductase [Crocinitomicaceae bacterium]|nr:SDR family NAD(P)-dependent oxidoreductase [Crocinitomicaceae bacterium]